jgi:hypothetical protein
LHELKPLADAFEKDDPAIVTSHFKPKRPGYDLIFRVVKETPDPIPLLTGDVIGCLRDALDHLVYELTVAFSGKPKRSHQTAWPVCEYRSQWPMRKSPTSRGINKTSGEWKVSGMHPKAQAKVWRLQPFYRKRSPGPHRKHPLWILDELRNLDRHRRLNVTPVALHQSITEFTLHHPTNEVLRTHTRRKAPKDGAVVERVWLSPGAKDSDVTVKSTPSCQLAWDEPEASQRLSPLIDSLEAAARYVGDLLSDFGPFQPEAVKEYMKVRGQAKRL